MLMGRARLRASAARAPKRHVDNFVDNTIVVRPESLLLIKRVAHRPKIKKKITLKINHLSISS
jgi:hypothetical protein